MDVLFALLFGFPAFFFFGSLILVLLVVIASAGGRTKITINFQNGEVE